MVCDARYVSSVCDRDGHVHSTSVHDSLDANGVCDSGDVDGRLTIAVPLILVDLSKVEVGGIDSVAVKCIDIIKNSDCEGSSLGNEPAVAPNSFFNPNNSRQPATMVETGFHSAKY